MNNSWAAFLVALKADFLIVQYFCTSNSVKFSNNELYTQDREHVFVTTMRSLKPLTTLPYFFRSTTLQNDSSEINKV